MRQHRPSWECRDVGEPRRASDGLGAVNCRSAEAQQCKDVPHKRSVLLPKTAHHHWTCPVIAHLRQAAPPSMPAGCHIARSSLQALRRYQGLVRHTGLRATLCCQSASSLQIATSFFELSYTDGQGPPPPRLLRWVFDGRPSLHILIARRHILKRMPASMSLGTLLLPTVFCSCQQRF